MDPILGDSSSIRPQAIGGLIQDGFTVLGAATGSCFRLPPPPPRSATWRPGSSRGRRLVDGSFVEDKVVKAPADSGAWPEFGASAATVALLIMMYLVSTAVLLPATIPAAAGYRITRVPWSSAARVIGPALASGILTLVLGAAGLLLLVLPGIWLLVQLQRGPGGARRRGTPRIRGAPPVQVARDRTMVGDVRPARDRLAPGR